MNSLTVNLHLLMATFYRPSAGGNRIVIEAPPSPRTCTLPHRRWPPRPRPRERRRAAASAGRRGRAAHGGHPRRARAIAGPVALVLLGGVNYLTGELLDIPAVTAAGHDIGAVVGWDLAHAAGNVPLDLHAWDVDWAAWCHYKYVNAGPGGPGAVRPRASRARSLAAAPRGLVG